jgi:hypothetical protein
MLDCLHHVGYISIPMTFELIRKPLESYDLKTRKRKRARWDPNELICSVLDICMNCKRYRLSDTQIQMARERGMNPRKFGKLANEKQEERRYR